MIEKIISGGQEGVERAALDIAIKLNIDHGGWVSEGHIPNYQDKNDAYRLKELEHGAHAQAVEQNVSEADGTLILSYKDLSGNIALNRRLAGKLNRPCLHIDLMQTHEFEACKQIESWLRENKIEILNVTGAKSAEGMNIYQTALNIIESTLYMVIFDLSQYEFGGIPRPEKRHLEELTKIAKTIDEGAEILIKRMTFREKTKIANLPKHKLPEIMNALKAYIETEIRIPVEDHKILDAYKQKSGETDVEDVASAIVITLWEKLRKSNNVLRVIK